MAWSCVGSVESLARVGWAGATITASAEAGGACASEEATTELNGSFRYVRRHLIHDFLHERR